VRRARATRRRCGAPCSRLGPATRSEDDEASLSDRGGERWRQSSPASVASRRARGPRRPKKPRAAARMRVVASTGVCPAFAERLPGRRPWPLAEPTFRCGDSAPSQVTRGEGRMWGQTTWHTRCSPAPHLYGPRTSRHPVPFGTPASPPASPCGPACGNEGTAPSCHRATRLGLRGHAGSCAACGPCAQARSARATASPCRRPTRLGLRGHAEMCPAGDPPARGARGVIQPCHRAPRLGLHGYTGIRPAGGPRASAAAQPAVGAAGPGRSGGDRRPQDSWARGRGPVRLGLPGRGRAQGSVLANRAGAHDVASDIRRGRTRPAAWRRSAGRRSRSSGRQRPWPTLVRASPQGGRRGR
jgi:hypothetical protein